MMMMKNTVVYIGWIMVPTWNTNKFADCDKCFAAKVINN